MAHCANRPVDCKAINMKEKILFLTSRYPYPPHKGDTIRVYAILQYLSQFYEIHLVSFSDSEITDERKSHLKPLLTQQTIWYEPITVKKIFLALFKSAFLKIPISAAIYESKNKRAYLRRLIQQTGIQKMYVFSLALMSIVPENSHSVYLDLCDVEIFKWHDYAKQSIRPLSDLYRYETQRTWDYLKIKTQEVSACLVISTYEKRLLTRSCHAKKPVYVIPNGVQLPQQPLASLVPSEKFTVIFVGVMSYRPNVEGILWFTEFVWPLLKNHIPAAQFLIVGQGPVAAIKKLSRDPSILVTGYVPDVAYYVGQADLVISPIKMAYGVQNKVLEALYFGKKLILTPQSIRGIDWHDEGIRVVARNPHQWLMQIIDLKSQLLTTEWLLQRRRDFFQRYYWENCLAPLKKLSELK